MRTMRIYGTEYCGPCRAIKEHVLPALTERYPGRVEYIDAGEHVRDCRQLGITRTPTSILYEDGVEILRHVGFMPTTEAERLLTGGMQS